MPKGSREHQHTPLACGVGYDDDGGVDNDGGGGDDDGYEDESDDAAAPLTYTLDFQEPLEPLHTHA